MQVRHVTRFSVWRGDKHQSILPVIIITGRISHMEAQRNTIFIATDKNENILDTSTVNQGTENDCGTV